MKKKATKERKKNILKNKKKTAIKPPGQVNCNNKNLLSVGQQFNKNFENRIVASSGDSIDGAS